MHKHEDYWGCLHVCLTVCLSVCGGMFFSSILMPLSLCSHCLIHCMPLFLPNKMPDWVHQSKCVYVVHTFRKQGRSLFTLHLICARLTGCFFLLLLGAGGFDGHLGCGRIISVSPHAFLHALFLSTLMSCDAQKTSVNAVLSFRNRQPALTDCNYVLPGTRSVCRTKCAGKHCEDYWVVLYKMSITHLACFAPLSRSPGVLLYFFPGN